MYIAFFHTEASILLYPEVFLSLLLSTQSKQAFLAAIILLPSVIHHCTPTRMHTHTLDASQ